MVKKTKYTKKKSRNSKKKTLKNKKYCSPSLKPGSASKTCFTKKGLVKIARAWNRKNSNNSIKLEQNQSRNKLWDEIKKCVQNAVKNIAG